MTIDLTGEERDALREHLMARLSGVDGIWLAVCKEDYVAAERLGHQYVDDIHLLNDLGWDQRADGGAALAMPLEDLRRVFTRLKTEVDLKEHRADVDLERSSRLVAEISARVLSVEFGCA